MVLAPPVVLSGLVHREMEKLASNFTLPKSTFPEGGVPSCIPFPNLPGFQILFGPVVSRSIGFRCMHLARPLLRCKDFHQTSNMP